VLLLEGERGDVAASSGAAVAGDEWRPSRHVLDRVRREKRTFWQPPQPASAADSPSLRRVQTVVAAPLLDRAGQVLTRPGTSVRGTAGCRRGSRAG
jgi:hypothetical protein